MVDYKIIKICGICKKRFVVFKKDAKKNICEECRLRLENQKEEELE